MKDRDANRMSEYPDSIYAHRSDVVTITSRSFADQMPRADRILQIRSAMDRGCYRIPTHVLTACLMFEMLQ
jgi:hypothetical protein